MQRQRIPPAVTSQPTFVPPPDASQAVANPAAPETEYAQMPEEVPVEMLTVPAFIRRLTRQLGHRFHMDEILRYGDKVGKYANSFHLSYMTVMDTHLGPIRTFPLHMLERVYEGLAQQLRWPMIYDAQGGSPIAEIATQIQAKDKLVKHLRGVLENAQTVELQRSTVDVITHVEAEAQKMREQMDHELEKVSALPPKTAPRAVQGRVSSTKDSTPR